MILLNLPTLPSEDTGDTPKSNWQMEMADYLNSNDYSALSACPADMIKMEQGAEAIPWEKAFRSHACMAFNRTCAVRSSGQKSRVL